MARVTQIMPSRFSVKNPGLCLLMGTRVLKVREEDCPRYRLEDQVLQSSIKRFGVCVPLFISGGRHPGVISGHKRLFAARRLRLKQIPVLVAPEMSARDAFLLGLVSNWKQISSDTDRAKALGVALRKFHFSKQELLSGVMPLLGLPEDPATLELYLKVELLPSRLKDLVEEGRLPLRGMAFLLRFAEPDQLFFAKHIVTKVKLTSSQLLQVGEWLVDLMKKTGKGLGSLCRGSKLLSGLDVSGMDARTKADRFFARVKELRFPGTSQYLRSFEKKWNEISQDLKGWKIEPIQGFEEPGFELHARIKTPDEMKLLMAKLSANQAALNSLFEIML